jgi:hypothetical protein
MSPLMIVMIDEEFCRLPMPGGYQEREDTEFGGGKGVPE